jgi:hypothetical protein
MQRLVGGQLAGRARYGGTCQTLCMRTAELAVHYLPAALHDAPVQRVPRLNKRRLLAGCMSCL